MAAATTVGVLSGHGRHASEVLEILHLLHRAGHEIKERIDDLFEDEDDEGKRR